MAALSFRSGAYASSTGLVKAVVVHGCCDSNLRLLRAKAREAEEEFQVSLCIHLCNNAEPSSPAYIILGCNKPIIRQTAERKISDIVDYLQKELEEA